MYIFKGFFEEFVACVIFVKETSDYLSCHEFTIFENVVLLSIEINIFFIDILIHLNKSFSKKL